MLRVVLWGCRCSFGDSVGVLRIVMVNCVDVWLFVCV